MNYSVLRTNAVKEKTVIFQTNSYTEASRVMDYFNENKGKYGYAGDVYEIIRTDYAQVKTIVNILK